VRSSSSRSVATRIRLQEKFRVTDVKPTDALTGTPLGQKEWFRKHASQIVAQAGNPGDLDPMDAVVALRNSRFVSIFIFRLHAIRH
jgi:hypothetical protein